MFLNKIPSTLLFLFLLISSSNIAQNEAVILYNSEPVKVELDEVGTILAFIGIVPNYMDSYNVVKEPIVAIEPSLVIADPVFDSAPKNAEYMILSDERTMLEYKPNFATLDQSILNQLNAISLRMKQDPNVKILLSAHFASDTPVNQKLADNRLKAVISYLKIKGIGEQRIRTEKLSSTALANALAVNYLQ